MRSNINLSQILFVPTVETDVIIPYIHTYSKSSQLPDQVPHSRPGLDYSNIGTILVYM